MANLLTAEGVLVEPPLTVAASYPNTPLNSTNEQRFPVRAPAVSALISSPASTPSPSSSSHPSAAPQRPSYASHHGKPFVSPTGGRESSAVVYSPPGSFRTTLLGQRCSSFVELLLATGCVTCQEVSRQVLDRHVRKKALKRSCEALTNTLQRRLGAEAAPAYPGRDTLRVLAAAAALCTRKQQGRLLGSDANDNAAIPGALGLDAHGCKVMPPYSATDRFPAFSRGSSKKEIAALRFLAASAARKQRTFPVRHIRMCHNDEGAAEIAFCFALPTQQSSEGKENPAAASREAADAGGNFSAADRRRIPTWGSTGVNGKEKRRLYSDEASAAASDAENAQEKHTDYRSAVREVEERGSHGTGGSKFVEAAPLGALPPASVQLPSPARRTLAALSPVDARPAATEDSAAERQQEQTAENGGERGGEGRAVTADECSDTTAATTAAPVARLTLQQLMRVVGGTKSWCNVLQEHLRCFAEVMPQLEQLSQLEGSLHVVREIRRKSSSACAPGEVGDSRSAKDETHNSGDGDGDGVRHVISCGHAGERNGSDGRGSDANESVNIFQSTALEKKDVLSKESTTDSDVASLQLLLQQATLLDHQASFLSGLQHLRLPRDSTLTAAEVLGVFAAVHDAKKAREMASEKRGDQLEATNLRIRQSDEAAASREEFAGSAEASGSKQMKEAGDAVDDATRHMKKQHQHFARAEHKEQSKGAARGVGKAVGGELSAGGAGEGERESGGLSCTGKSEENRQHYQQPRIVSLAELPDLSVLERSSCPEGAAAACVWQKQRRAEGREKKRKRTLGQRGVAVTAGTTGAGVGGAEKKSEKAPRRPSSGSSVVLLECGGISDDREGASTNGKEVGGAFLCKRKRSGTTGAAEEEGKETASASVAAGEPMDEEEELVAGAKEAKVFCEAVLRETVKLLELVAFYESFSSECLTHNYETAAAVFTEEAAAPR